MYETPRELENLQELLDRSAAEAGAHLSDIITPSRRLNAAQLCEQLRGLVILALATVTADGRPLVGPVDGYFLHGEFYFTSSPRSVRVRHLRARPALSASYVPRASLAVTVHGEADFLEREEPAWALVRTAILEEYQPRRGEEFAQWLDGADVVAVRVRAKKLFTFSDEVNAYVSDGTERRGRV